jgi:hypothetical protein
MNLICNTIPYAALIAFFLPSCGDDPKLVEKRDKQKIEIARLKQELSLIEEKIKNTPPDVTAELAEAKQLQMKQSAEVENLNNEIVSLEAQARALKAEYDAYRIKYEVK